MTGDNDSAEHEEREARTPELSTLFQSLWRCPSPFQRWIPTLDDLASDCRSILELGARNSIITWALLHGLCIRSLSLSPDSIPTPGWTTGEWRRKYILNDLKPFNVNDLLRISEPYGVLMEFYWQNDLSLDMYESVDMVVIDTLRVYAHLKKELEKFSRYCRRYIVVLNTTVYHDESEMAKKSNAEIEHVCVKYGYKKKDVVRGLMPAILEFLESNGRWTIHEVIHDGSGLVVLLKN